MARRSHSCFASIAFSKGGSLNSELYIPNNQIKRMSAKAPTMKLSDGNVIPIVGLGTWKSKPGEVRNAVKVAIDGGYRHIDCALAYQNETEVGEAIKEKIEAGVITRSDIFVTSKLWNTFHRKEKVFECCQRSLKNLGLDYVNLYLIHWPIAYAEGDELFPKNEAGEMLISEIDFIDTWEAMEELKEQGLVRSIGLSNFNHEQINRILDICKTKPVMLQVECHPYLNQNKLIEFCKKNSIAVTAYSPLGSPDRPWVKKDEPLVLENETVKVLAEKYNKTPAQILLKYQVQRGVIVIPKSVTQERIEKNIELFDFELTKDELDSVNAFQTNYRYCHLNWLKHHPFYPFHLEF